MLKGCCILFLTLTAAGADTLFKEDFENGLKPHWKPLKFEGLTSYKIVAEGTNHVMQASAQSAASGLLAEVQASTKKGLVLSWRWKIDQVPQGATRTDKKTFDHTARMIISHKPRLGLPTTLNYVWSADGKIDEGYDHPGSGRSKFIILQSSNAKAGQWLSEKRDVVADWKKAFGEAPPNTITAVGFMTDSDGTQTHVIGNYDDIVLTIQ
ncbi:MAG TPA: DUF3047 domain-containing protein [Methylomirabilota bacterium]|nr:DUF3047 domain-containing protein [Methylomirabilota bacterium]